MTIAFKRWWCETFVSFTCGNRWCLTIFVHKSGLDIINTHTHKLWLCKAFAFNHYTTCQWFPGPRRFPIKAVMHLTLVLILFGRSFFWVWKRYFLDSSDLFGQNLVCFRLFLAEKQEQKEKPFLPSLCKSRTTANKVKIERRLFFFALNLQRRTLGTCSAFFLGNHNDDCLACKWGYDELCAVAGICFGLPFFICRNSHLANSLERSKFNFVRFPWSGLQRLFHCFVIFYFGLSIQYPPSCPLFSFH